MALNVEEWNQVGEVFKGSLEHVLANSKSFSTEAQDKINRFLLGFVMIEKPYMLATPAGVQHAVETVFTDEIVRDFVLTLVFVFTARWGSNSERFAELVESLAFAVSAQSPTHIASSPSKNSIPSPILAELPKEEMVVPVLLENKWLVVLLLAQLTVQLPVIVEGKQQKKHQQQQS
jgi:hypothetical protein